MEKITESNFSYLDYKRKCVEQSCNIFFKIESEFDIFKAHMVRVYEIEKLVSNPNCKNSEELLQELYSKIHKMSEEELCDEAIYFAHLHSIQNNVSIEGFLNLEFKAGLDDDLRIALDKFKANNV
jgi:hypothetical protein